MDTDKAAALEVEYQLITTLKPYPRNARTHSKQQIRKIADSIKAFGFTNPVLTDRSHTIMAGHGRVEAAKLLGMTRVPTIRLENLSPDQIRAYILADNRLAEKAGWDNATLAIELQHLLSVDLDFEVTLTGFEVPEIDLIIGENRPKEEIEEEEPIEVPVGPAVTKPGDLWLLGNHRLVCGNALDESSFSLLMNRKTAHLVFTDPPYNVKIDGNVCGNGRVHHREFAMASGEMTEAEFTAFLDKAFGLLASNSKSNSVHFICMDWRHAGEILAAGKRSYDTLLNLCVWTKDNGGMGSLYRSQHEFVFVFRNGGKSHRNNIQLGKYGRNRTNVWRYPGVNTLSRSGDEGNLLALHPTVKPVAMVADAILDCSAPGEIVLDSFAGAGSTLIAAERVGRTCYALEIDPVYVDTIIRRWEKQTGNKAVHAGSSKTFGEGEGANG
jgi:DNA modification methylase